MQKSGAPDIYIRKFAIFAQILPEAPERGCPHPQQVANCGRRSEHSTASRQSTLLRVGTPALQKLRQYEALANGAPASSSAAVLCRFHTTLTAVRPASAPKNS